MKNYGLNISFKHSKIQQDNMKGEHNFSSNKLFMWLNGISPIHILPICLLTYISYESNYIEHIDEYNYLDIQFN